MNRKYFKEFLADIKKKSEEKQLLSKIEAAFINEEFKMYLQFIVDNKTKKLASAEALSRWINWSGETIFPGTYIGLMEKSGIIVKFDYYMFDKVCSKLAQWKNTEFGDFTLSCNITRITISEKNFAEKIEAIAQKYDFDRKKLLIEITEDAMEKNLAVAKQNIIKAKELGFSIALDDMGTGYTSLVNICEYPIDVVKIDRDVLLLAEKENGRKLFLGIIALINKLNLKVVCEGVETQEQNDLVSESECDYIQGWYYSKGVSESQAEEFAKAYMSNC